MPSFVYENQLFRQGYRLIAGVDEAGRGPLAGPVVAAAVILPKGCKLSGLDDSKKLSPSMREKLFLSIKENAISIGIGIVSHTIIDKINIYKASLLAMKIAVEKMAVSPDYILIDGKSLLLNIDILQRSIIGGDRKSNAIAAASIIAKVTRDDLMLMLHKKYPQYGFNKHKGYGTREHYRNITKYGPCKIHRRTFNLLDTRKAFQV